MAEKSAVPVNAPSQNPNSGATRHIGDDLETEFREPSVPDAALAHAPQSLAGTEDIKPAARGSAEDPREILQERFPETNEDAPHISDLPSKSEMFQGLPVA